MRLKCTFDAAADAANKTKDRPDVDLKEHLAATNQAEIPQAKILQQVYDLLLDKGLLEEAYLRGSFGRGHADHHSDIDLFTVIDPAKVEEVYNTVSDYLKDKGCIITSCHDRLVENYGGIGFMFVAHNDAHDKTFQFDLYMAMKGVPPRNPTAIRPRIFAKDPNYSWMNESGKPAELPEQTQAFIKKHTSGGDLADKMELMMQEMLLNLYVTHKHIKRGQMSRTVVDNHSVVTTAIEMMQVLTGYRSRGYSPVYLGDEVVRFAKANGDKEMIAAANRLDKMFLQPMSDKKLRDALDYSSTLLEQSYPERYARLKPAIEHFKKQVLGEKKPAANDSKLPFAKARRPKHAGPGAPGASA